MQHRTRLNAPLAGAIFGLALALAVPAAPGRANGTPIRIVLWYVVGVSSWGPQNATGVAELVTGEGEIRLTATGLPNVPGEQYQLWIINTGTGERMSLGSFKPAEGGVAKLDLVLKDPIPDKEWDLMLVSVEPEASQPSEPSDKRSIAGRVPEGGDARPGQLPNTGAEIVTAAPATTAGGSSVPFQNLAIAVAVGLGLGLIGFGLGRLTAPRRSG